MYLMEKSSMVLLLNDLYKIDVDITTEEKSKYK